MSPPLVVAFAIAGRVDIIFRRIHWAGDSDGQDVYLRDIWPSMQEISGLMRTAFDLRKHTGRFIATSRAESFMERYSH